MEIILVAVGIVSGIGLLIGIILSVASAVMAVPKDEKTEELLSALPGANCGACGYSGCEGYAKALAGGDAVVGLCSPGGDATAQELAGMLGVAAQKVQLKTALVHCMGSADNTQSRYDYQGITSCAAAASLCGGVSQCLYGCIGLGDCERACPYGAIKVCNGVAIVNPKLCRGCSVCVGVCPKHIISFVPATKQAVVRCSNCDKGAQTKKVCKTGCIGCMRCVKVCESGAVTVSNFKATVDTSKCTGCLKCVEECKQGCITIFEP